MAENGMHKKEVRMRKDNVGMRVKRRRPREEAADMASLGRGGIGNGRRRGVFG
jgi:hypothetical protein